MNLLRNGRLLMTFVFLSQCWLSPARCENSPPAGQCPDPPKQFHLEIAKQYEAGKAFDKATKEFLAAGESSCEGVRREAAEGLKRMPITADSELELGLFYESQGLWTEADAHFSKAAEITDSPEVRHAAFDGLWRVNNAQNRIAHRTMDFSDFWSGIVGRVVGAVAVIWVVIVIIATMFGNHRALLVHPFEGQKETAEQVSVAFPAVQAHVSSVFGTVTLPEVVRTVYPFISPRLGEMLPDQPFELGGVKLQNLSYVVRLFARPRFEVYGGVLKGESSDSHLVYAQIWRRWMWLTSKMVAVVSRNVPIADPGHAELQVFVYDVLLKAHESLRT
jgi:hypothetical protein